MSGPTFGVVIPVAPKRRKNLTAVLECLVDQQLPPHAVVLVCDGPDAWLEEPPVELPSSEVVILPLEEKHQPGMPQPRNRGAALLRKSYPEVTHVAFLDSDVLVDTNWLAAFVDEMTEGGEEGCYAAPYDWLPDGKREIDWSFSNDTRWPLFENHEYGTRYRGSLGVGLACYSGNLVWNLEDFRRVGGFWSEIHHGRCEDGELGLRAVHMGVPIGLVPNARGWHLYHGGLPNPTPKWRRWAEQINAIDVPKLKQRHPWTELGNDGKELFVVDEDGKRFNVRCRCGWEGNTAEVWQHEFESGECSARPTPL